MPRLAITLIDVGWGDSVLVEADDNRGTYYGLVDSNDTMHTRSSYIFLKRFFERAGKSTSRPHTTFEFVLLTHAHADHAEGLPRIIREFGAKRFLHPSSNAHPLLAQILRYQRRRHSRLGQTQSINRTTNLTQISFGAVRLNGLWPPPATIDPDENNNSIVLALTLGDVSFVLTGDATAEVWPKIVPNLPRNTRVFQVPHHGARNGTFDSTNATPWLSHFQGQKVNLHVAMSSHTRPHRHPHQDVINVLNATIPAIESFRTDVHYHIRFETNGKDVRVHYSHR
jgi:beta-lactamase superfamily II metal-dependent hydrolase